MNEQVSPSRISRISMSEIHRATNLLIKKLKRLPPFNPVVAVARGGITPALLVAQGLNIPHVDQIHIAPKDEGLYWPLAITPPPEGWTIEVTAAPSPKILVIDEFVDSGATATNVHKLLPHAHFAAVYARDGKEP